MGTDFGLSSQEALTLMVALIMQEAMHFPNWVSAGQEVSLVLLPKQ
jgi:hypothetical protein